MNDDIRNVSPWRQTEKPLKRGRNKLCDLAMSDFIYLDNQATTPTDPRVVDAMLPYLGVSLAGNPHSEHYAGRRARLAVENARAQVAELIGSRPEEIIFTSGATEANNLALQGIARSRRLSANRIVACSIEHSCVLEALSYLGGQGSHIDVSPVNSAGLVDVESLGALIRNDTALVSIMMANNEIGVVQPIAEIATICELHGAVFHSDAAQAVGKIPVDVKALGVDLMSLSGHKLYAPIGIGALYLSDECPFIPDPVIFGGGQERGIRSGTLSTALCVALGAAAAIAKNELADDAKTATQMRERFLEIIRASCANIKINGDQESRIPGNLSLTFPGVDANRLIGAVQPDIALSTNAACASRILGPSHVLSALGVSAEDAACTVRVGFGRFNTMSEIETAAHRLNIAASQIRISDGTATIAA